jgi:DNA-binding NtrC family response regulator
MLTPESVVRVLVVDDEKLIADTLALILTRAGFRARAAYSGEDAVDMAPSFAPHFLISDVVMQGINGVETANRITQAVPGCRVLLFSGQATRADLDKLPESTGQEFNLILKPIHPTELINILNAECSVAGNVEAARQSPA